MKHGDRKIFLNIPNLYRMLNLRRVGYATSSLALLFNTHRTSIAYQCDKYNVQPLGDIYTLERIVNRTLPKPDPRWKIVNGERINLGRPYREYFT